MTGPEMLPTIPTTPRTVTRLLMLAGAFAALLAVFFLFVRPWYLRWGATDEEQRRVLPGDEIVSTAGNQETRAITINASADWVWQWLAQLGQDRAGFYSFDLLENAVGCRMPLGDALRPDRQTWQLGQRLWMYPPDRAGGLGYATLRVLVSGRALGFGTHVVGTSVDQPEDGSWSFVLEPLSDARTRLIVRGRAAGGRKLLGSAFDRSIFEPVHFVMERRMMLGLKDVAETGSRSRTVNNLYVALWTITFALFVAAAVKVVRRQRPWSSLAAFFAAAVVFQILTLVQPPIWIGVVLAMTVVLTFLA